MTQNELIAHAFAAMKNAYAPYSKYHVGACVLCSDGNYFYGANVENASYGLTNCGERSALFAAYSKGYRKDDIIALAIVSDGDTLAAPCGACRQVINELMHRNCPIYLSNGKESMTTSISELLPMAFGQQDLHA
jgi:cytidine deaminase